MTVLSTKIILQRIFEGTPTACLDGIKAKIFPDDSTITNQELAEKIIKLDYEGRRKFSEIFKIDPKEIQKIAGSFRKISMEDKRARSKNNKLPILFDSLDFVEKIRPANIDLRLGDQYFVSREKYPKKLTETGDYIVIEPGDFAILTTHEYLYVPDDLLGFISLRNKYKKLGIINISGFHVDPGYFGRILFSIYNAGPESVVLKHKESVFMITYDKLEEDPVLEGYGQGIENISADEISRLIGYSISPVRLKKRIDSLEMQVRIIEAIAIAVIVAKFTKLI